MAKSVQSKLANILAKRDKEDSSRLKCLGETLVSAAQVLSIDAKIKDETIALALLNKGMEIFASEDGLHSALQSVDYLLAD